MAPLQQPRSRHQFNNCDSFNGWRFRVVSSTVWIIIFYQILLVASQLQSQQLFDDDDEHRSTHLSLHHSLQSKFSNSVDRPLSRSVRSAADCQQTTCRSVKDRPVCASDGKTYSSKCQLRRIRDCQKISLNVVSKGPCPGETKCQEERRKAVNDVSSQKSTYDQYIPECKPDGRFSEAQCHNATGYCWCVTASGKPIPGSSVQDRPINCTNQAGRHTSFNNKGTKRRRGLSTKNCIAKNRTNFNKNLVRLFTEEYNREPEHIPLSATDAKVVEWKFSKLDLDKDKQLKLKEIQSLRTMVVKHVKPHSCASTFVSYCDRDDSKVITPHEWTTCLGTNGNDEGGLQTLIEGKMNNRKPNKGSGSIRHDEKKRSRPRIRPDPSHMTVKKEASQGTTKSNAQTTGLLQMQKPSNSSKVGLKLPTALGRRFIADSKRISPGSRNSCVEDREKAQVLDRADPDGHIFIPECDSVTGLYKKAQCHNSTGYCWCVDDQSGLPIPGISTHNVTPDCNELKNKKLKGCPFPTKKRFLMELLDHITQQMVDRATNSNSTSSHLDEPDPEQTIEERAVRWKLRAMDLNRNGVLERNEIKVFKEEIKSVKEEEKYMRKCRRNFLQYCDEDNNSKITMEEWVECMGLNDQTKSLPENPKRKGPNPFSTVLKS